MSSSVMATSGAAAARVLRASAVPLDEDKWDWEPVVASVDGRVGGVITRRHTNAVNGNTGGDPLLHLGSEAGELRVRGAVEVVVVDVELRVRSGLLGSVESNADELLTQNLGEDGVAKSTILSEDLVDDVLAEISFAIELLFVGNAHLPMRSTCP
jgi:hypothetical protein